ncbi:protein dimerization [Tasmannia lanceolata]|uniref:protein dimerization n=1 Tax=Tasmannia lanceolata TaxID=3420 RepID=UPI0040638932
MSFEGFEGFDEWDEKFLDQAIRLEEEVISTRNATQSTSFSIPTYAPNSFNGFCDLSFSPPRELSQKPQSDYFPDKGPETIGLFANSGRGGNRVAGSGSAAHGGKGKEKEIERLKRELGRVSKQLNLLEHECTELKKDRDKKDEQLKHVFSQMEAKDTEIHCLKKTDMNYDASMQDHPQISLQLRNTSTSIDHVGTGYPIFGAKSASSAPWPRESTSKRSLYNTNNELEHEPTRKDVQNDALGAASELKRRILIDSDSAISNRCSIQGIVFPETTAQAKCTKSMGVQTNLSEACSHFTTKNELSTQGDLSNKLLSIWDSPKDKTTGRNLVSKLFETCALDFYVLFRCMGMASKITLDSLADENFSDGTLHDHMQSVHSIEALKVSRLYDILMKVSNEMVHLDALLEALLDICVLENAVVVHRSLRIVRVILQHMLIFGSRFDKRDNVMIIHSQNPNFVEEKNNNYSKKMTAEFLDLGKVHHGVQFSMNSNETSFPGLFSSSTRSFDVEDLFKEGNDSPSCKTFLSPTHWISLFETMHRIALGNTEEYVQVEALSIMNLILMKSDPNSEREKFGLMPLFECMSPLLRKKVGLHVQKQAVRLLFLLLNCPKLLAMFCNDHKAQMESVGAADVPKDAPIMHGGVSSILEGLTECIACKGSGTQELKLRRHAIILLAFIASSGKSGFEILLNLGSTKRISFLELIVQVLASEMDAEAAELADSHDLCKERMLLMREALILLNRLASNPIYSTAVLGVLTSSRAMANLTLDVADRISRKSRGKRKSNTTERMQMKEAEIVELARVFSTRVFSFLGDNIS